MEYVAFEYEWAFIFPILDRMLRFALPITRSTVCQSKATTLSPA